MKSNLKMIMKKWVVPMVAALVAAPVAAKTKPKKMRISWQRKIVLRTAWEEVGEEMNINEEENNKDEFGYRLSSSQFDLAMKNCSQNIRGGTNSIYSVPKKSKPPHISNEDEVMSDAA